MSSCGLIINVLQLHPSELAMSMSIIGLDYWQIDPHEQSSVKAKDIHFLEGVTL